MNTANLTYLGELRTEMTHIRSGKTIITDAPVDNHGKGEAFSPTDLVAAAFIACMVSIMGIVANKNEMQIGEVKSEVLKVMGEAPRRIVELQATITFEGHQLNEEQKAMLERAAHNCPVAKSLHADMALKVTFVYL
ncbi:MAG: OsmC family protein [Bacteroidia bacterium]